MKKNVLVAGLCLALLLGALPSLAQVPAEGSFEARWESLWADALAWLGADVTDTAQDKDGGASTNSSACIDPNGRRFPCPITP
jgi:hypothetical protein